MYTRPLAYFITFRTYGTWLHGDDRLSVDRTHATFGQRMILPNIRRETWERNRLAHSPVTLDDKSRAVVDQTIREVCDYRRWRVHALSVRTNHVHVVVEGEETPERMMNSMKAWATRRLVEQHRIRSGAKVWSRHGSTLYLFKPEQVTEKCWYVLHEQ